MSFAVVMLSGFAGDKAHLVESGDKVFARLSIATHRREGEEWVTDWHDVIIFNPPTVERAKRVARGDIVAIAGRLEYRKKPDSNEKYARIVADRLDCTTPAGPETDDKDDAKDAESTAFPF